MLNVRKKEGFTLVELLVVISIISLLTSIVLASLNTARAKARDAKRMQDINQIWTALQLYYDKNGYLPMPGGAVYPETNCGGWDYSSQTANCSLPVSSPVFLSFLESPEYMAKIPLDPINNGTGDVHSPGAGVAGYAYAYYCYYSGLNATRLRLRAKLETGENMYGSNPYVIKIGNAIDGYAYIYQREEAGYTCKN